MACEHWVTVFISLMLLLLMEFLRGGVDGLPDPRRMPAGSSDPDPDLGNPWIGRRDPSYLSRIKARRKIRSGSNEQPVDDYYTMHLDQSGVTLKVKENGSLLWVHGVPSLYSVLQERVVRIGKERVYSVEAAASGHWICMNEKGRLYTIPPSERCSSLSTVRIRHSLKIGHGQYWRGDGRRANGKGNGVCVPPKDCLFKTYEFNHRDSFERSVAIYSYAHSNKTHGRFLSMNEKTGQVRSYRRAFRHLPTRPDQVKITQVPVRFLQDTIKTTRFGKSEDYNEAMRKCIIRRLEKRQKRRNQSQGQGQVRRRRWRVPFRKMIEGCRRRRGKTRRKEQKKGGQD